MKKMSLATAFSVWARENVWTILILTLLVVTGLAGWFINRYQYDWTKFTWPAIVVGVIFSAVSITKFKTGFKKFDENLEGTRLTIFMCTSLLVFITQCITRLTEANPLLIIFYFLLLSVFYLTIMFAITITLKFWILPISGGAVIGISIVSTRIENSSLSQKMIGLILGGVIGYLIGLFIFKRYHQPNNESEIDDYILPDLTQSQELIDDMTSLTRRGKFERAKKIVLEIKSLLGGHEFEQTLLNNFWSHIDAFQNNITKNKPINPEEIEKALLDLEIAHEILEKMKPEEGKKE